MYCILEGIHIYIDINRSALEECDTLIIYLLMLLQTEFIILNIIMTNIFQFIMIIIKAESLNYGP